MKNRPEITLSIIGILIAIFTGLFGDNWFQQFTGQSFLEKVSLVINESEELASIGQEINFPTQSLIIEQQTITLAVQNTPTPTPVATTIPAPTTSNKDGMTLLFVPAGKFIMGSQANADEQPVHALYLSDFWIDKTEVTNSQYSMCVSSGKCKEPSQYNSETRNSYYGNSQFDSYPVIYVSWEDAKGYCEWAGRDLPTEAQWEKAASWNYLTQESYVYPWGNIFNGSFVNFCDFNCTISHADNNSNDGHADTAPVMSYPNGISPYGAYDMAGNVWEWVNDWYNDAYYYYSSQSDPMGPDSGTYRVLRGDSWWGFAHGVRSADRNPFLPSKSANNIGFRCARSAP